MLESKPYVRKPFKVEVIEITKANFEECAQSIGEIITPEGRGDAYILVDKDRVPGISKVFPGMFMTKYGSNIRCFTRKIFFEQFVPVTDDIQKWMDYLDGKPPAAPTVVEEYVDKMSPGGNP